MNRRHLRAEDGVVLLHVLRKRDAVVGAGNHLPLIVLLIAYAQGGNERADTDSGGPQVVDFVDLEHCIDLSGAG